MVNAKLQEAITDSQRMKDDILESISIILHESDEEQFRPIMTNYQENLKKYKTLNNRPQQEQP